MKNTFLYDNGRARPDDQNWFAVEQRPLVLIAANMGAAVIRVQVLAGDNGLTAAPEQWADMRDPYGNIVSMHAAASFIMLSVEGVYRLHPDDLDVAGGAIVWLSRTAGTRAGDVRFVYEQFAGSGSEASQTAALIQATNSIADAYNASGNTPTFISSPTGTIAVNNTAGNTFELDVRNSALISSLTADAGLMSQLAAALPVMTIQDNGNNTATITSASGALFIVATL